MKKGSITRYDQELVLETIADYDNTEISAWVLEPVKEQIGGGGDSSIVVPLQTINLTNEQPYAVLNDVSENITNYTNVVIVLDSNWACAVLTYDSESSTFSGNEYKWGLEIYLELDENVWKISIMDNGSPLTGDTPIIVFGIN